MHLHECSRMCIKCCIIDLSPRMRFYFRWGQRCALFRIIRIIAVERRRHDLVLQTSCNLCPALYSTLVKTNNIALHCTVSKMEKADALAHTTSSVSQACVDAPVEQWTCRALQWWLKSRGFTYSGLRKAELVDK